jgi:starvation-inducible DNA-binding protein
MTRTKTTKKTTRRKTNAVADAMARVLADTYAVYLQTHTYHWNVTGPQFHSLHMMFEVQYNEMWMAVDLLAERIRALGEFAPGSAKSLGALSDISFGRDETPKAEAMVKNLLKAHETLIKNAKAARDIAAKAGDSESEDMLIARIQEHEKTVWMLRATLG